MPTLTSYINERDIEADYTVSAGEAMIKYGTNAGPGCDAELHFTDEAVATIELEGTVSADEWDRLEQEAWTHYAKECKDAAEERHSNP